MNETEQRGRAWLVETYGYADHDIVYQARRSPDFVTPDGKGWEVKKVRNGTVVFFPAQLGALAAHPDVTVLIFNGHDSPEAVIPYTDLTVPGYHGMYRFVVANRSDPGFIYLVRFPEDLYESLREAASRNDRTVTGEIIHRLRLSITPDEHKGRP